MLFNKTSLTDVEINGHIVAQINKAFVARPIVKFVLQTIAITMSRKPQGFFRLVKWS